MTQAIKVIYSHPELSDLDQDNHPIYLLADGARDSSGKQHFNLGATYGTDSPGQVYLETISNAFNFVKDDVPQVSLSFDGDDFFLINNVQDMRIVTSRWMDFDCGLGGSIEFNESAGGMGRMLRLAASGAVIELETSLSGNKITNLADGASDTDAVNIGQLLDAIAGVPTDYVSTDGSSPLTANWDAGAYTITSAGLVLADNESLTLGTGSDATLKWDGTNLVSTLTAGEFQITGGKLLLDNNEPLQIKDTGGTYRDILYISGGNNVILGMIGTGWGGSTNIYAGTRMYFYVNRATASKGAGLIDPNGRWCIGSNYTPTAVADIDASTTAAASMRLRSGTAPTSPNAGDIWYDGTNLKFYDGVATRTLSWT